MKAFALILVTVFLPKKGVYYLVGGRGCWEKSFSSFYRMSSSFARNYGIWYYHIDMCVDYWVCFGRNILNAR